MKRFLSILLTFVLLCTALPASFAQDSLTVDAVDAIELAASVRDSYVASGAQTPDETEQAQMLMQVDSVEEKDVPMYVHVSTIVETQKLTFFNGNDAVAYMEVEELFEGLKAFMSTDPGFELNGVYGDKFYIAIRENGEYAMIDFELGLVVFSDYDMFGRSATAVSGGDLLSINVWQTDENGDIKTDENGERLVNLFRRRDNTYNFTRNGYSLAVPVAQCNIPLYWADGKGYMPVTTFADLFLSCIGLGWFYNGDSLFLTPKGSFDDTTANEDGKTLNDIIFETSTHRSKELAEYTYWEIVMMLEGNYGLRDEHRIGDDFDEYFEAIGLKDRLMSRDGAVFSSAVGELAAGYFGDMHSGLVQGSPYAGIDYQFDPINSGNVSSSYISMIMSMMRYRAARDSSSCMGADGHAIPYLEVGNTAYVTFDQFALNEAQDYYDPDVLQTLSSTVADDNIALIHYANERINREGSPIENVVIDLSVNGGGAVDAAIFVGSWVMGGMSLSTINPMSQAQYTVGYNADVNLDGYITSDDYLDLTKVKVFCLTSGYSFSCGNLIPAVFKESGVVTLLGRKSGGGACAVESAIAADGTIYQYSSRYRLSTVKNGSYYSIDQGIEPDYVISDPAHFYDRAWLTDYINQLP